MSETNGLIRTVKKVNYKKSRVIIKWDEESDQGTDSFEVDSFQTPTPEFVEAFKALDHVLIDLCEFPQSYCDGITVTGVTYVSGAVWGVVVTGSKTLKNHTAPLNLNTPFSRAEDENGPGQLTTRMISLLTAVEEEAVEYINGARAQLELELPEAESQVSIKLEEVIT